MDHLKEGIGLRGYGQKNPLNEYKKEGYQLFMDLMDTVKLQTVRTLFRIQVVQEEEVDRMAREQREKQQQIRLNRGEDEDAERKPVVRHGDKVGRNEPCPCGSGQKYKRCCGKAA
jgi:preprotein translocase subunit SecA